MSDLPTDPRRAEPGQLVAVDRARGVRAARERSLVLHALGVPHLLQQMPGGDHVLFVPTEQAERAQAELASYDAENRAWPPREAPFRMVTDGLVGALVYCAVLSTVWVLERGGAFGPDPVAIGRTHAERIRGGEVWRAATALTLHSDLRHLASNVFFGALFGALLSHVLGSGLAWACVLAAGVLGNLANALVQDAGHRSIGASTAVFGALGCLATVQWSRRPNTLRGKLRAFAPFVAGAVILGFFGGPGDLEANGPRVDVAAHVTGVLAGISVGLAIAYWKPPVRSVRLQTAAAIGAALVLVLAWAAALATA